MTIVILPDVRLSYPDIWKPGDPSVDSKTGETIPGKFGCQAIFSPTSEAATRAKKVFLEVATAQWKQNAGNVVRALSKEKKCIRNGNDNLTNDGSVRDGYGDLLYIVARNKARPAIVAHKFFNGAPVIVGEDGAAYVDGKRVDVPFKVIPPFGGCYVNLKVDIYAMDKPKIGKSINATLLAVQYLRDGPAFGASAGTAEGFEDLGGEDEVTDADGDDLFGGEGADDDIAF